jgi:hypothetical protein
MSDEERIFLDFEPNDMIVRLTPFLDEKGDWTGELMIGCDTTGESTLNEDDYANLMRIVHMTAASIQAMEESETVRNILSDYADNAIEETIKEKKINSAVTKDGNVIEVNFQ